MKNFKMILLMSFIVSVASAQTKTTEKLDEKHDGMSLYFYKNTLRMLNQKEDKEFDAMIKDIEKIRFLMIDRAGDSFSEKDYKKLKSDYVGESYESIMTGRYDGKFLDVFIRETNGSVKGTVVVASDSSNVYVLDILGKIAIEKVGSLFKMIDENSDVARKLKNVATEKDSKFH